MKFALFATVAATIAITIGAPPSAHTYGFERSGVCEVIKNVMPEQRKTCLSDHFNSGMITITTDNGTLSFKLHSSRLREYSLNGAIYVINGDSTRDFCMWSRANTANGFCFRQS